MKKSYLILSLAAISILLMGCEPAEKKEEKKMALIPGYPMAKYASYKLTTDISHLSANQHQMLKLLFEAAEIADEIFWVQNVGEKKAFLETISGDSAIEYATINYGPWDELNNLAPFIEGYGEKPAGAQFYPHNMSKEEFEAFDSPDKKSLYTLIERNENGGLKTVWYHEAYKERVDKMANLLEQAAALADDPEFANYLNLRAQALKTDDYFESDMAWLTMKNNQVDIVIGPIENYTDGLFGYKAAYESYVLIKDVEWSEKLAKYAAFLPQFQKDLPVDAVYKQETPGSDADLNAYDVLFYAGDCNMAGKTIAINLPNDERVQLEKGTRKLQLKNAMRAKFDYIMLPISNELITPEQREMVTFDAFFANTMFHEVAHGLGIKNTITDGEPVRKALKEKYSAIEEGKADILGVYFISKLAEMGDITEQQLLDSYVTFMAGIFRSVRFGASSAHGMANMLRFNFFLEQGAFTRNDDGTYTVNLEKMQDASTLLTQKILKIQGDGDYEAAAKWIAEDGVVKSQLQADLDRLDNLGIPSDIVFEQGPQEVGL
ncbi:MAG TPA: Zn-dependent hydrolase [Bacteroidales bacterium]